MSDMLCHTHKHILTHSHSTIISENLAIFVFHSIVLAHSMRFNDWYLQIVSSDNSDGVHSVY